MNDSDPLEIRLRDLGGLDIRMRYLVAGQPTFATDVACAGHVYPPAVDIYDQERALLAFTGGTLQGNSGCDKGMGEEGEEIARDYLEKEGFKIVATNVEYKTGEIDIIARRGKELHFVEVKARGAGGMLTPLESITEKKKKRMRRTAEWFLADPRNNIKNLDQMACFFSVIGITYSDGPIQIECVLDAFI